MLLLHTLIWCILCGISNGSYFTSVDNLGKLRDLEQQLVSIFDRSISVDETDIHNVRRFLEKVKKEHEKARENMEEYVSNPINAYSLIKRMTSDWLQLKQLLTAPSGVETYLEEIKQLQNETVLPTEEDVVGAAHGMVRIQTYYDLKTGDLTEGIINGTDYGVVLNWSECYEIAKKMYAEYKFQKAKEWFLVALNKLERTKIADKESIYIKYKTYIYEYLALLNYELGYPEEALVYIEEVLSKYPKHPIKETKSYILMNQQKNLTEVDYEEYEMHKNHTLLCQGLQKPDPEHRKLYCKLSTKNQPYFILAPLKAEVLKIDPEIVFYHNILNDRQIDELLEVAAKNKYFRSEVLADNPISDVRVSMQTWLTYETTITKHARKMLSYITGLTLNNIESIQVVSYGIGGQYDPHPDNLAPTYDENDEFEEGDRLATCMFYLSDVEQGGYTAFPGINIFSRPIKGGLIVWYNLLRRLDGDARTWHGGCPILKGIKRIANVWIHSQGEVFTRPCMLDRNSTVQDLHLL